MHVDREGGRAAVAGKLGLGIADLAQRRAEAAKLLGNGERGVA